MPDIPKFPAFEVTSNLQRQINFNKTAGFGDPLAGTGASIPSILNVQSVSQNPDGSWNQQLTQQASPVQDQGAIENQITTDQNNAIISYEELGAVYDAEMLRINNEISDKKSLIVSLVTDAISAGCTSKRPTGLVAAGSSITFIPGAEDIGGVAVGVGSTVSNDKISIKIYPSLSNYSTDTPYDPDTTEQLSTSNYGKGYANVVSNNGGSGLSTSYRFISSETAAHSPPLFVSFPALSAAEIAVCAGYGASIINIANEIELLREERDADLDRINDLKELKTREEVQRWGYNQGDSGLDEYNTLLESAITLISNYTDNIVTENLIVHYDAGQTYGIQASVESVTNINAISQWNNLVGDGLYASPRTSLYSINLDSGDGSSVELNNYPTQTNQYLTVASSFIEPQKIGTGSTTYTIESWFKVTNDVALGISSTTNGASIVGVSSEFGYGLQVYKPSGIRLSFGERSNGSLTNTTDLSTDTWYHVVATNDSTNGSRIYLNGTLDGTGSQINITTAVSDLQVGFSTQHIDQYFSGKISIIRIYNSSLTQDQVTQNYNAHKTRFGY